MAIDSIERIRYYERQFLGALDFDAQQAYHRDMRRRHNLAPHTWGIHVGLELHQTPKEGVPDEVEVCILPGAACDGFGREIIVLQPYKIERGPFLNFGGGSMPVWIAYDQEEAQPPRSGYELCDVEGQFARVRETFRIVVGPFDPFHERVRVAGKDAKVHGDPVNPPDPNDPCPVTIPSDESAPYQEFP